MVCVPTHRPIKIKIGTTNLTGYNIPIELIENISGNDYLVLFVDPDNYDSRPTYDDIEIFDFGNLPNLLSEVYTTKINIDYTQINVLEAINAIARNDILLKQRTEILDYVRPNNFLDTFTTRLGTFNFPLTYKGQYINERPAGIDLVFLELPQVYRSLIIEGTEYFVKDSDYKITYSGQATELVVAGQGSFLKQSLQRKGFQAKLDYSDISIYRNILSITENSYRTKTPLTVIDNVSPEGYGTRIGFILPKLEADGVKYYPNTTQEYLPKGFSILFQETTLRYV